MKQRDKIYKRVNGNFTGALCRAFYEQWGLELEPSVNILGNGPELISRRKDGEHFTIPQWAFIKAFEAGYIAAMDGITNE